jgi:hypothetical protein
MSDESAKSNKQFWWGSVVVPLVVAFISGAIVWSTGIFDAQSKLIDAEKIEFKNDTTKYEAEKAIILARITTLSNDDAKLLDSIKEKEKKLKIADSILKVKDKSMSAQQQEIAKLTFDLQALQSVSIENVNLKGTISLYETKMQTIRNKAEYFNRYTRAMLMGKMPGEKIPIEQLTNFQG